MALWLVQVYYLRIPWQNYETFFFFFPNVLSGVRLNPKTVYPAATNRVPHAALFMPRISVVAFVRAR